MIKILSFFIGMLMLSCTADNNKSVESDTWRLVFKNDKEGNTLYGNKSDLIDAVRGGYRVRVGWGGKLRRDTTKTIEHLSEVAFLTILNGKEVFAQLPQVVGQQPVFIEDSLKVQFREDTNWTKIVGTNGYSTGRMINVLKDTLMQYGIDGKTKVSWFVYDSISTTKDQTF